MEYSKLVYGIIVLKDNKKINEILDNHTGNTNSDYKIMIQLDEMSYDEKLNYFFDYDIERGNFFHIEEIEGYIDAAVEDGCYDGDRKEVLDMMCKFMTDTKEGEEYRCVLLN